MCVDTVHDFTGFMTEPIKEIKKKTVGGAWVAQLVKCLTLDFGSGHDLTVCEIRPHLGLCADSTEPAWDSFCLSLPLSELVYARALSIKINIFLKM